MLAEIVIAHQERAVIRAADVFIKIDTDADRVERERAALGSLSIPVPRLLWHRAGAVRLLAVSEVGGDPLAASGSSPDQPGEAWAAAGQMARRLHDHEVPPALSTPTRYRLEELDQPC